MSRDQPDRGINGVADSPRSGADPERGGLVPPRGAGGTILRALALGPHTVGELVRETGLSQPNVSNHLARLRERGLVSSQRQGRQVVYQVSSSGLAHFVLTHGDPAAASSADVGEIAAEFREALLTLREEEAARVVDSALAAGLDWRTIYLRVFVPALVHVGERWEQDELPVAAEHLMTGITLRLLHRLSLQLPSAPPPNAPTALVGCVEGELHTVGGRMVADFLISRGWRVWYLNGYLPLEHLLEAVRRHLPDAVVLCVSTEDRGEALRESAERLGRWRGEQPLPLLVAGGRYFDLREAPPGFDLTGTDIESVTAEMHGRVAAIRGGSAFT